MSVGRRRFQVRGWWLALVASIAVSLLLQTARIAARDNIVHDEGASYLYVTGHTTDYREAPPENQWIRAEEWKQLWQPAKTLLFAEIRSDLAQYGIAPPLYFWILHIWTAFFGVHLEAGLALNLVFFLLACPLLYLLARRVLLNRHHASAVVILWALSPAIMAAWEEVRQYALLGLISLAFALLLLEARNREARLPILLGLAICTAAGMLTHLHFGLLVFAGLALITVDYALRRDAATAGKAVLALAAGFLAFAVVQPGFFGTTIHVMERSSRQSNVSAAWKPVGAMMTLGLFYLPHPFSALFPSLLLTEVVWGGLRFVRRRTGVRAKCKDLVEHPLFPVLFLFGLVTIATLLLYSLGLSPEHAMTSKYIVMTYPLAAFSVFVPLARLRRSTANVLLAALCVWQAAYAMLSTRDYVADRRAESAQRATLDSASCIVLDSTVRGVLTVAFWEVPDDMPVLAASQDTLLAEPAPLLSGLRPGCLYINSTQYGNTEDKRDRILQLAEQQGLTPELLGLQIFWATEIYRLQPSHSPQ